MIDAQVTSLVDSYTTPVMQVSPQSIRTTALAVYTNLVAAARVFKTRVVQNWCMTLLVDKLILACLRQEKDTLPVEVLGVVECIVHGIPKGWIADDVYTVPEWCAGIKQFLVLFAEADGKGLRKQVADLLIEIKGFDDASKIATKT